MNSVLFVICFCAFLLQQQAESLKCRAGNQQTNAQFHKALQICRKRSAAKVTNNENSWSAEGGDDSTNDSSDSGEEVFDKKFFFKKDDSFSYEPSGSDRTKYLRNSSRRDDGSSYRYNRTYGSSRDFRDNVRRSNNGNYGNYGNYGNSRTSYGRNDGFDTGAADNYSGVEEACVIQCFFNELNVVDQKGFPERDAVIHLMSQDVQDPELRDFLEESVTECYRYLETDSRREKCDFSLKVMMCLAVKGKEKCEDWGV